MHLGAAKKRKGKSAWRGMGLEDSEHNNQLLILLMEVCPRAVAGSAKEEPSESSHSQSAGSLVLSTVGEILT